MDSEVVLSDGPHESFGNRIRARVDADGEIVFTTSGNLTFKPDAVREFCAKLTVLTQNHPVIVQDYSVEDVFRNDSRVLDALRRARIDYVWELTEKTSDELLRLRGVGKATISRILQRLGKYTLTLKNYIVEC